MRAVVGTEFLVASGRERAEPLLADPRQGHRCIAASLPRCLAARLEWRLVNPRQVAPRRALPRITVCVTLIAAALSAASARAATPAALANPCGPATATAEFTAATNRTGLIDLYYFRPMGLPVRFYECFGERAQVLGDLGSAPGSDRTVFLGAAHWDCDRPMRYFAATTTGPSGFLGLGGTSTILGTTSVRTGSCERRFAIEAPERVTAGRLTFIRVVDRWGAGDIATKLCLTGPKSERACRTVTFAEGVGSATRRFRVKARGRWHVELQVGDQRVRSAFSVGTRKTAIRKSLPTLLATGDSTMEGVESFLSDDLEREANVVSDVRPGAYLSGSNDWAPIASAQAAKLHPVTTVLSIGANEGLPVAAPDDSVHNCCDAGWVQEYARRLRAIMLTYARNGLGRVFVLTIAAPRDSRRAPITAAVNDAIVLAGEGLAGVHVLRMDLLFSPDGYSPAIHYGGEDVDVREADGVHLNVAGQAIEARVVADALHATAP
jgi:hypothetical protein